MHKKILLTGAAGFIGFHLSLKLIDAGFNVFGIDNINDYYDTNLKRDRLKNIEKNSKLKNGKWEFLKIDIVQNEFLEEIFEDFKPEIVINLAAQAGVRYSIKNPSAYLNSNIIGFGNILECCRKFNIRHLIYASSSSVYGGNKKIPFSENDGVNHPVSLYAATKRSNELMAHTYSHLYNLPTTGLRFFTVYGPWGRPDMSYFIFTSKILKEEKIQIFNNGEMERDFTYIDDVTESILKLIIKGTSDFKENNSLAVMPSVSWCPFKLFNIGNSSPVKLMDFIKTLENNLGKKAKKEFTSMQPGDVHQTYADTNLIAKFINYNPNTNLDKGIKEFIKWYLDYYKKDYLDSKF